MPDLIKENFTKAFDETSVEYKTFMNKLYMSVLDQFQKKNITLFDAGISIALYDSSMECKWDAADQKRALNKVTKSLKEEHAMYHLTLLSNNDFINEISCNYSITEKELCDYLSNPKKQVWRIAKIMTADITEEHFHDVGRDVSMQCYPSTIQECNEWLDSEEDETSVIPFDQGNHNTQVLKEYIVENSPKGNLTDFIILPHPLKWCPVTDVEESTTKLAISIDMTMMLQVEDGVVTIEDSKNIRSYYDLAVDKYEAAIKQCAVKGLGIFGAMQYTTVSPLHEVLMRHPAIVEEAMLSYLDFYTECAPDDVGMCWKLHQEKEALKGTEDYIPF